MMELFYIFGGCIFLVIGLLQGMRITALEKNIERLHEILNDRFFGIPANLDELKKGRR